MLTTELPQRLIAPVAAANLEAFDPDPLATYITAPGDTLATVAKIFYGAAHPDLLELLAGRNGVRPTASLPGGVPIVVPQPHWRLAV